MNELQLGDLCNERPTFDISDAAGVRLKFIRLTGGGPDIPELLAWLTDPTPLQNSIASLTTSALAHPSPKI